MAYSKRSSKRSAEPHGSFHSAEAGTRASQPPRVYGSVLGMETSSIVKPGLCKQGITEGTRVGHLLQTCRKQGHEIPQKRVVEDADIWRRDLRAQHQLTHQCPTWEPSGWDRNHCWLVQHSSHGLAQAPQTAAVHLVLSQSISGTDSLLQANASDGGDTVTLKGSQQPYYESKHGRNFSSGRCYHWPPERKNAT